MSYDGRMAYRFSLFVFLVATLTACTLKDETAAPPDVAAPPADALRTSSGIASKMLRVGLGADHPTARSTVTVQYSGWTTDGKLFDGPSMHGGPQTFVLNQVIPGWTEGVQLMVKGEKRRFWIPGNLAYDNIPRPDAPKGMLVFDIELLEIQ
jgi:FKBP-type peptidyl-prolyl cis-trans isomerase